MLKIKELDKMNEIRKNEVAEESIAVAKFEFPETIKKIFIIAIILCAVSTLSSIIIFDELFLAFNIVILITFILAYVLTNKGVKQLSCELTTKRIKGTSGILFKKSFSYRLDMIDFVEVVSFFGVDRLVIHFSQGKANSTVVVIKNNGAGGISAQNIFNILWLSNGNEMYKKISEMLTNIKNEVDTEIDIEMKKIEVEEEKTKAFIKIAENINDKQNLGKEEDYISQMERLFILKERGIITQEEFDEKKKDLL